MKPVRIKIEPLWLQLVGIAAIGASLGLLLAMFI